MTNDPIVEEVRKIRDAFAAEYNYDLDAIFDELKKRQESNPEKYVSRTEADSEFGKRAS